MPLLDYTNGPSPRPKRRLFLLIGVPLLLTIGLPLLLTGGYTAYQNHRMELAFQYSNSIRRLLPAGDRFSSVLFEPYIRYDGSLVIDGAVFTEADYHELQEVILTHPCPVPIVWQVTCDIRPTTTPSTTRAALGLSK